MEAEVDPILKLLNVAGFHDGHAEMFQQEAAVGRDLGAFAPRIVAGDDDRPAAGIRAGQIRQGQGIRRHVQPDALHGGDGLHGEHLRAVEGRAGEGFVVGLKRPHPLLAQQRRKAGECVKETGHG